VTLLRRTVRRGSVRWRRRRRWLPRDHTGIGRYVDWLIDADYPIQRITDYDTWLQRFETAMRALPERQRRIRYCRCCTPTNDPKSRTAGPSGQSTVSSPPCEKRKSAPTKTSRTLGADHRQVHHQPATARTAMRLLLRLFCYSSADSCAQHLHGRQRFSGHELLSVHFN